MRRLLLVVSASALTSLPLSAQAPEWAVLWRVAGATLASPAPLERGPVALFWNPAAVSDADGVAGGLEVLHTSEVLSLSGLTGAVTYRLGDVVSLGLTAGRVSVGDLVRTTTSPVSQVGDIVVHAQFVGFALGRRMGRVRVGAHVRLHDARLDARSEDGATVDLGLRVDRLGPLVVAAASHFAATSFDEEPTTEYLAAAEYLLGRPRLWGAASRLFARYGVGFRATGEVEHSVGSGLEIASRLRLDVGVRREVGYDRTALRPAVGIAFRAGRYMVAVARGDELNDLGATYRISLSAGVGP